MILYYYIKLEILIFNNIVQARYSWKHETKYFVLTVILIVLSLMTMYLLAEIVSDVKSIYRHR